MLSTLHIFNHYDAWVYCILQFTNEEADTEKFSNSMEWSWELQEGFDPHFQTLPRVLHQWSGKKLKCFFSILSDFWFRLSIKFRCWINLGNKKNHGRKVNCKWVPKKVGQAGYSLKDWKKGNTCCSYNKEKRGKNGIIGENRVGQMFNDPLLWTSTSLF